MISYILGFTAREHGEREIVSLSESGVHRYTYRDAEQRARRLASALTALGVAPGERVATLAWNSYCHFEIYYGVPGMGAVCHTLNPRLFADQLQYVINHAGDSLICVDRDFLPMLEPLAPQLAATVRGIVVLCEAAEMPATFLAEHFPIHCYEALVAEGDEGYCWPVFDENTASSLCYTSGTTGNPKGVLYSHSSTLLHALAANMKDAFGIRATDVVLPLIPMFHANAWSLPYTAAMAVHHPKWDERPLLLVVVPKPGKTQDKASILALYAGKVASWWCPDAVEVVAELPHTGTGKVLKTALREQYRDYCWP